MSWIAPLNRVDATTLRNGIKRTQKVYLKRVKESWHPHAYMSVRKPEEATQFTTKEEAEAAQALTKKHVEALPKPPEWVDGFQWPLIEFLPVEEV